LEEKCRSFANFSDVKIGQTSAKFAKPLQIASAFSLPFCHDPKKVAKIKEVCKFIPTGEPFSFSTHACKYYNLGKMMTA